ncbi:uncharacterized protein TNCT_141831, partial [Trichonephila clavata]
MNHTCSNPEELLWRIRHCKSRNTTESFLESFVEFSFPMNSKITHVTQFKSRFRNISPEKVVPQLNLRLGSKLRHSNILEGNDVYFECNIRASPWVHETGWRFEGQELVTNISAGVIVSNQSLVLQKVQRRNRGRYSCTGTNSEGQGESNHVYLRVQ